MLVFNFVFHLRTVFITHTVPLFAVLPDFSQVYGFIGSVFDPNVTDQLQNLKKMDPIDVETVCLCPTSTILFFYCYKVIEHYTSLTV